MKRRQFVMVLQSYDMTEHSIIFLVEHGNALYEIDCLLHLEFPIITVISESAIKSVISHEINRRSELKSILNGLLGKELTESFPDDITNYKLTFAIGSDELDRSTR